MSLLDTASLIVTPNGYKEGKLYSVIPSDGSGDLSVTRATTATRVNSQGLVELVPYNLIPYSQEISNSSFWSYYISNVTANTTTAPDGSNTADTIAITGTNGSTYQTTSVGEGTYTISAYFKKINEDNVYMDCAIGGGNYFGASFNLTTLVITTFGGGFSPLIESVGNGWYRCSVQGYANGSGGYGFGVYAGAGQSAYIWGAQLNEGTIKPYQKTETRLNIPRLDYSNGTCPSILVEPQRTNLLTYSSSFDNAAWTTQTISVTSNSTTAPDGTLTADTLTPSGSILFDNRVYQPQSVTNGVVYTLSVWAKSSVSNAKLTLALRNYGGQVFDITDQWERYSVQVTAGLLGGNFNIYAGDVTPTTGVVNSSNVVTIWGAQLEVGSYPTSYIPTTSASVTRNADVISKTGISSLIGQTEGTLFFDLEFPQNQQASYIGISDGTTGNRIILGCESGAFYTFGYGFSTLSLNTNTRYKIAMAYNSTNMKIYANGTLLATVSGAVPSGMSRFAFDSGANTQHLIADVYACSLWKTKLTDSQLATLTTI